MKETVFWHGRTEPRPQRPLAGEARADVVVVGGGVTGLACAQRLRAGGVAVAVVERDACGSGASGRSSGFVTPASELELASLVAGCGPAEARRIWEFVAAGVELIRANVVDRGFACDFQVQDCLPVASAGLRRASVRREHETRLELGYASRYYGADSVREALGTDAYAAALRYGGTFGIDPYAYCLALRDALEAEGAAIFEGSPVTELRADGVRTAHGAVRADRVVVCADRFIPDLGALRREIYHVQTFLGITKPLPEEQLRRVFPGDCTLTWDSSLIYDYFRVADRNRLLLGGGDLLHTYAREPAGDLAGAARRLCAGFAAKFPGLDLELECVWSGMLGVSKDLLPVMGPHHAHDSIWFTGAATGLPWAAALGAYAAERILGGRSDFDAAFSSERKFVIGPRLQACLSTPLTFAIANGVAKLR